LCILILGLQKKLRKTFAVFRQPRNIAILALTSGLLTINWTVYIWSVSVNKVVEASLGYYISPLVSVAFGVVILREKMHKLQWIAVFLAFVGVLVLTFEYGSLPWIALALAVSWGAYSLLKKSLNFPPLEGISIETTIALLPSLVFMFMLESQGKAQLGHHFVYTILLVGAGLMTVVPLLLFNEAMIRLPLTISGLLQYLTPTIMFMVGTVVNHESMPKGKIVGFAFIWVALVFLGTDLVKSNRASASAV